MKILIFLTIILSLVNPVEAKYKEQKKLLQSVNSLVFNCKYSQSIEEYDSLLADYDWRKKELIEIHTQTGICYDRIGRYDKAIASFQNALLLSPKNPEIHLNLGLTFEKIDVTDEAINLYQEVIKAKKGDKFQACFGLGRIYQQLGLNTKAIKCYKIALRIKSSIVIYRNISKCYELLNEWDSAIEMLNHVITLEDTIQDRIHLAFLYSLQNKYSEVIEILSEVLTRDPDNEQAMLHLASAYFKTGNSVKTKKLLSTIKQKYPHHGLSYFLTSIVLYFENKPKLARMELKDSIKYAGSPMLKEYAEYFLEYLSR